MKNRLRWMMTAIVLAGVAASAWSQDLPEGPPMPAARRVEQLKKIRIQEALKLDEETSVRFFARYNKHQESVRELQQKMNDLIDRLEEMRKRNADPKECEPILQELQTLQGSMVTQRKAYIDQLREILSPGQLVDYVVFERNFYRDLRRTVGEMQRERMDRRFRR